MKKMAGSHNKTQGIRIPQNLRFLIADVGYIIWSLIVHKIPFSYAMKKFKKRLSGHSSISVPGKAGTKRS